MTKNVGLSAYDAFLINTNKGPAIIRGLSQVYTLSIGNGFEVGWNTIVQIQTFNN